MFPPLQSSTLNSFQNKIMKPTMRTEEECFISNLKIHSWHSAINSALTLQPFWEDFIHTISLGLRKKNKVASFPGENHIGKRIHY